MLNTRWTQALAIAGVTGFLALTGTAGADSTAPIQFNYGAPTSVYPVLYVAEDLGLFEEHGLKPNFHYFDSGAPLLAGLESESLDVVTTGLASIFAVGRGIPVVYLFWEGDAAQAEGLVARDGVDMQSVEDLSQVGTVGVPTGTCAHVSLFHAADKAGIPYKELDTVDIAPPLYANAFHSESIDAGLAWSPYLLDLQAQGHEVVGFDPEWVPGGGACPDMTLARKGALEENPELGHRLAAVNAEARKALESNPDLGVQAIVSRLNVSREVAEAVLDRYLQGVPSFAEQLSPDSRYALVGADGLVAQLVLAAETFAELGVLDGALSEDEILRAIDADYIKSELAAGRND
ncbi:ABC transporter substrate-binding protein [Aquisalimonas lutea]|uniref:ABC transporter substrate-binding protein n=1 Tax=Aquisalimonas lutea TaxID=1327750 RepID=UPI0025B2F1C4|nr:ABC transporter substrate-binding protein [Aquisalimonas lutea]MDN3519802.1 ABC transporter substrate-binding protein [Aquisalimonas lutea]